MSLNKYCCARFDFMSFMRLSFFYEEKHFSSILISYHISSLFLKAIRVPILKLIELEFNLSNHTHSQVITSLWFQHPQFYISSQNLNCWCRSVLPFLVQLHFLSTFDHNFDCQSKRDHRNFFIWVPRLWVGRRQGPLLVYIAKIEGKHK